MCLRSNILGKIKNVFMMPLSLCLKEKPCIAFDLDNTLIYSTELPTKNYEFECKVKNKNYYVHVRYGAKELLKKLSESYEIFFFTASAKEYGEKIISNIAPFMSKTKCFFNDSCLFKFGYAIKDLKLLKRPIEKIVLVDDMLGSGSLNPINTVAIEPWNGSSQDRVLTNELFPLLESCEEEENIANAVHAKLLESSYDHLACYTNI